MKKKIYSLPNAPGVYQFLNKKSNIIYIGKAKNIKKRVSSYFNKKKFESKDWLVKCKEWKNKYPIVRKEYYKQKNFVNPYVFIFEL